LVGVHAAVGVGGAGKIAVQILLVIIGRGGRAQRSGGARLIAQGHRRLGLVPAVRLNGSSDLPWERLHPDLFAEFPNVQFFDYTKVPARMERFLKDPTWPKNYHLTFSAQPHNHDAARNFLDQGGTVAVVFWPEVPQSHWGKPVIDGDKHDARFLDQAGTIVGLKAKGQAKNDTTGFVIRTAETAPAKARKSRPTKKLETAIAIAP
jgi:hypothetical protein